MHRALSLSAATLALSALLPSVALAQTATYTLSYSCTAYSGVTARDLPLRDFGGTECFNVINNTAVGKRSVARDFQSSAGYFGGWFSANYIADQWHGGGASASLHLDDFRFSDNFTVVYDDPAQSGTVNLTLMVDGDLLTRGYGNGYSSNGSMSLSVRNPWQSLGTRGFSGQFTSHYAGSAGTTDLSPLTLTVKDGDEITLSLFADVYVQGLLTVGLNGMYPDDSGADARGFLTWWVEAPTGVRLVSASGHDYTQRVLAVPEPSAIAMLLAGVGVVGVAGVRARRRARAQA